MASREKDHMGTVIILVNNLKIYYKYIQIGMHPVNNISYT